MQTIRLSLGTRFTAVGQLMLRRKRSTLYAFLLVLIAGAVWLPFDLQAHYWIWQDRPLWWAELAQTFRDWGNFTDTVLMCGALALAGKLLRKRYWRRVAVTTFMAACCSGIFSNIFRFSVGRERPPRQNEHLASQPYIVHGPTFEYKHQSFPSGHSATSSACGTAMFTAAPKVGWIALVSGIMVVWSSVYHGTHYFSDCTIGAGIGVLVGLLFGLAHRRLYPNPDEKDDDTVAHEHRVHVPTLVEDPAAEHVLADQHVAS